MYHLNIHPLRGGPGHWLAQGIVTAILNGILNASLHAQWFL